ERLRKSSLEIVTLAVQNDRSEDCRVLSFVKETTCRGGGIGDDEHAHTTRWTTSSPDQRGHQPLATARAKTHNAAGKTRTTSLFLAHHAEANQAGDVEEQRLLLSSHKQLHINNEVVVSRHLLGRRSTSTTTLSSSMLLQNRELA
ncbi:unnamed protein product, partial [Amoebophrya sp. A120]